MNTILKIYCKTIGNISLFIIVITINLILFANLKGYAQETLQTVTTAGSSTNQRIALHNALELDVIPTPADNLSNSYLSQYAYTTVNGATNNIAGYMLLRAQGAYWYNGASGLGFYNKGPYSRPVMEVISGNYGNYGSYLPANCAIRNNFLYQFIAGTTFYSASNDNLITASNSEVLYGVSRNRKLYINKGLMIGTTINDANSMLQVNGNIAAKKLTITQSGWPDYVFDPAYELPSLVRIEKFIQQHKHLPDVPSHREMNDKGLDVGEMQKKQMQKIEEIMLYLIEINKKQMILEKQVKKLKSLNQQLMKQIRQLKST